jgi:hypothetical protein
MEFNWFIRFRVAAAMLIGIILIAVFAGPKFYPYDPEGPVTFYEGSISVADFLFCAGLAFAAGFISFFVTYPYGAYIAPLAAPAGLAFLASHGSMFSLMITHETLEKRQALYQAFRLEGFLWILLFLAGYAGVYLAWKVLGKSPPRVPANALISKKQNNIINIITGAAITGVVAFIIIAILAQDVRLQDKQLGTVVGQPGQAQIAFAVLVAFGVAAYLTKYYLHVHYLGPSVFSAVFVLIISVLFGVQSDITSHMLKTWPASFYPKAISAITPIQMVSFAVIGSIAGFWIAIKHKHHKIYDH